MKRDEEGWEKGRDCRRKKEGSEGWEEGQSGRNRRKGEKEEGEVN